MSKAYHSIVEYKVLDAPVVNDVVAITSTAVTLSGQSGALVVFGITSGSTVTLPSPKLGLSYDFVIGAVGDHKISGSGNILGGLSNCSATTASVNCAGVTKGNINFWSTAGSVIGDTVSLKSNGSFWFAKGLTNAAASVSFS